MVSKVYILFNYNKSQFSQMEYGHMFDKKKNICIIWNIISIQNIIPMTYVQNINMNQCLINLHIQVILTR